jgi:hypothetical protein
MAGTITWKTKGKAKERPKNLARTKEGRELVPLMVGSYLPIAPLMSLACKS